MRRTLAAAPAAALPRVPAAALLRPLGGPRAAFRRWERLPWRLVAAFWGAYALFDFARTYAVWLLEGRRSGFHPLNVGVHAAFGFALWALVTQGVVALVERWPVRRRGWPARLALHLGAAAAASLALVALGWGLGWIVPPRTPFVELAAARIQENLFFCATLAVAAHVYVLYGRAREREVRAAQLQTQLATAQLEALKMQLEPHFLFNTLNSVAELIHESPDAAERMLASLADMLRLTLERGAEPEVTLEEELRFLAAYLEIQQTRFQGRLLYEMDAEPGTLQALVPPLVLQPLVENAVRHGLAPRREPGSLRVLARRDGGALRLEVHDDGVGLAPCTAGARAEGVGLGNTRARLERLYGRDQALVLEPGPAGGTVAAVTLPFHAAPLAASGGGEALPGGG